ANRPTILLQQIPNRARPVKYRPPIRQPNVFLIKGGRQRFQRPALAVGQSGADVTEDVPTINVDVGAWQLDLHHVFVLHCSLHSASFLYQLNTTKTSKPHKGTPKKIVHITISLASSRICSFSSLIVLAFRGCLD